MATTARQGLRGKGKGEARASVYREPLGGEYEVVPLWPSWSAWSYFCLLLALLSKEVMRALPWRPRNWDLWMAVYNGSMPVLAGLGVLAAMVALRRWRGRWLPRLALILNGLVFLLSALAFAGIVWVARRG